MGIKTVVSNKKAYHDYEVLEKIEAGISLQGTEVKSIRLAKANLSDGWVEFENDQATLLDVHISPYSHGNIMNHGETRPRKLLLKHAEIVKLQQKVREKNLTVVPLRLYFKDNLVKVEIGLARGKKSFDKREASKKKDADKQIQRTLRNRG